ncbi:MAG: hypothetical protein HZA52_19645 [Planctomycetes bacterium]|nr:hypothetical protein [Planctomycetota bacterium]
MTTLPATFAPRASSVLRFVVGTRAWWLDRALAVAAGTNAVIAISAVYARLAFAREFGTDAGNATWLAALALGAFWSFATFGGFLPNAWLGRRRWLALATGVVGFVGGLPLGFGSGSLVVAPIVFADELRPVDFTPMPWLELSRLAAVWTFFAVLMSASLTAQVVVLARGFTHAFARGARATNDD